MDIVAVDNLVKRYNEVLALDHFNLHIEPGEVFGLLGPNGSGKTTAINCILQLLTYDKGTIELFGQTMRPTSYDLKRRIGIVPQNVAVFEELNVRENIDYFCALYVNDRAKRRDLVDEAIAFVGLEDYAKFRPRKLSGGLLRRLNIACGIAHKPELIFFDEPTVDVDPQSRNAILEGIQEMNRQGSTVVYTSHYMEEVEEICTRIMIMDHGKALGNRHERRAQGDRHRREDPDRRARARRGGTGATRRAAACHARAVPRGHAGACLSERDAQPERRAGGAAARRRAVRPHLRRTSHAERRVPGDHRHRAARLGAEGPRHVQRIQRRPAHAGAREEHIHLVVGVSPDPVYHVRVHVREPRRCGAVRAHPTVSVADENLDAAPGFPEMIDTLSEPGDDQMLDVVRVDTEQEARSLMSGNEAAGPGYSDTLSDGAVGYFTVDADGTPTVHVKAGVTPDSLDSAYQSILKTIGDAYVRNVALIEDVAATNPAALADTAALEKLLDTGDLTEKIDVTQNPPKESVRYFFALLGMAALFGWQIGMIAIRR